jgi:hypothetical protein
MNPLEQLAQHLESVRDGIAFGFDAASCVGIKHLSIIGNDEYPPEATQHILLAQAALDQAQSHLIIANYCDMQNR